MIKKEWSWMLNLPIDNNDDDDDDDDEYLEDGVDDFISTNKPTPYNDDDYDN